MYNFNERQPTRQITVTLTRIVDLMLEGNVLHAQSLSPYPSIEVSIFKDQLVKGFNHKMLYPLTRGIIEF